jgi:hypothetical protein
MSQRATEARATSQSQPAGAGQPAAGGQPGGAGRPDGVGHASGPSQPDGANQPAGVPTVAGRVDDLRASLRRALSGTPGRLRILALVAVGVSLIFALGAFSTFGSANDALGRAGANAAQLVRIQAIHTNLVRADADATNAFLVGGLEPADQRASYTASVEQASRLIADAARAQPADGPALGALNTSLLTYAGLIEQARATNRQALPVGAQYLKLASSGLRSEALPILDALVTANDARVRAELGNAKGASAALVTSGVLALLVLAGGMVWLSRRTHRYVNPPLAAATAAVLVTLVIGFLVLASVGSRVDTVRSGSYAGTLATAQARIAAFDAKSNESLTLIARGSGSAFEQAWKNSSKTVTDQSAASARLNDNAASLTGLWNTYVGTHTKIRASDDGGNWDAAVKQAIGKGSTSSNASFDAFDTGSAKALTSSSNAASDSLDAPRTWLALAAWLGLLVGIAAAVSAWWGVSLRLEEYR